MNKSFTVDGNTNLLKMEKNDKFVNWLYSTLKPFISGNILEIGSGIGTYSKKIVRDFPKGHIYLSDIDSEYVESLKGKFKNNNNVTCINLDLEKTIEEKTFKTGIDTVIASNVLEHIKNDIGVLKNIYRLLDKNGKFLIIVPAHMFLFNSVDKAIGHYRRYTESEIRQKVYMTDFSINKLFYFNLPAMFGWYLEGNILKKTVLGSNKMSLYNKLVPLFEIFEKYITRNKIGTSLVVILEKIE